MSAGKPELLVIQRACERRDDAYRVFRKMLESGHLPDDWDRLLVEAQK